MFVVGVERSEIARHTREEKGRMKTPDHDEIEIRVDAVEMQLEELVCAQQRKLETRGKDEGVERREAEAHKQTTVVLPKSFALLLPKIRRQCGDEMQCGKDQQPTNEDNLRLVRRPG